MALTKIIFNFDRLSDIELSAKVQEVTTCMTDNENFPAPVAALDNTKTVKTDFDAALVAAKSGDRTKIAIKNEKRTELIDQVHQLARYTEMIANGNRSILMGAGFDVTKERSTSVGLGQPETVRLSDGENSGELLASCGGVQGAKSYVFQHTLDPLSPSSVWVSEVSTKSEHLFKGLTAGQKYWSRIIAIGSNDQQTVSNPVARFVQ
jgi:hypothetical protein